MIRTGYIHENDDIDDILISSMVLESECNTVDRIAASQLSDNDIDLFKEDSVILENKIARGIEKVGEMIENAISKIVEFVKKCVIKIQDVFWSKKTDIQKINIICKKNPALANDIKIAFKKGDLDVRDIKSLQEVMDGSYDLLSKLDSGKIEPSKAESLFDKIIYKYERYGRPLLDFAKTTIAVSIAIKEFSPKIQQLRIDSKINKNTLRRMKLSNKLHADEVDTRIYTVHGRIVAKLEKLLTKHASGVVGIAKRFGGGIDALLRASGLKSSKEDMQHEYDALTKQSEYYNTISNKSRMGSAAQKADRVRMAKDEYAKQMGKNVANDEWNYKKGKKLDTK